MTFSEIAERFLKSVGPDLAPATLARYEEHLRIHVAPSLGGIVVTKLKPVHLAELYAKLRAEKIRYVKVLKKGDGSTRERIRFGRPLSANSVLRVHRLLHRLFGWAEPLGLVQRNVPRLVQAPKQTPSPARALTVDQVEQVLAAAEGTRFHSFFILAAETGMRRGEVGALTWDCIDFDREVAIVRQAIGEDRKGGTFIKNTKSGRQRVIPLNASAVEALRRHRAVQAAEKLAAKEGTYTDQGLVFASEMGSLLDLDAVSKAFSSLLRGLGIKAKGLSLHSCRHFVGTTSLVTGSDVRTVSDLLGHADPGVTLRVYGHVVAGAKERAVTSIGDALTEAKARRLAAEN